MLQHGLVSSRLVSLLAAGAVAASGCDATPELATAYRYSEEIPPGHTHLVTVVTQFAPDGSVQDVETVGKISPIERAMAASPAAFPDASVVVNEEVMETVNDDGSRTVVYRAFSAPNVPVEENADADEGTAPFVSPGLLEELAASGFQEEVSIAFRLAGLPPWAAIPSPDPTVLSISDYDDILAMRSEQLQERQVLVEALASGLVDDVIAAGGSVLPISWPTGWVHVTLPAGAAPNFLDRSDVLAAVSERGETFDWAAVPGSLGAQREAKQTDADAYWVRGMDGSAPNVAKTGASNILIGIVETFKVRDEACAFQDDPACLGSRFHERYQCTNANCTLVANVDDQCEQGCDSHATAVTSVAAGDYMDHQGRGRQLGDPDWICANPPCPTLDHGTDWEVAGSGFAPEAEIVFASFHDANPLAWVTGRRRAYETLTARLTNGLPVDIMNMSHTSGFETPDHCRIRPLSVASMVGPMEESIENAFAQGIFLVGAAGNNSGASKTFCSIGSASQMPVVFTVNAYDVTASACQTDQRNCRIDTANSARGGGIVANAGWPLPNKRAIIDAIAPNRMTRCTRPYDYSQQYHPEGWVAHQNGAPNQVPCAGTSFATPIVAGAAALVKHEYLSNGFTFVNNPGWLHTIMLSSTDRHDDFALPGTPGPTSRRTSGASEFYGLGRLKLRNLSKYATGAHYITYNYSQWTNSWTGYYNGGQILPSKTKALKCVAFQHEYMYKTDAGGAFVKADNNMNLFYLQVEILDPGFGGQCNAQTPVVLSRTDVQVDNKKLVAIEASEIPLGFAGKCARLRLGKIGDLYYSPVTINVLCRPITTMDDDYEED